MCGPAYGGLFGHAYGTSAPFLAAATLSAVIALLLARSKFGAMLPAVPQRFLATIRRSRKSGYVRTSLAMVALSSATSALINVLVPLRLHSEGLSAATIGVVFSVSFALFAVVSGLVTRVGNDAMRLNIAALVALATGLLLILPMTLTSSTALVMFVLLRAPAWGVSATIVYPFAGIGADRVGVDRAAVFGALNMVWGLGALASPLLAGWLAQAASDRVAYGVLLPVAVAISVRVFGLSRAEVKEKLQGRLLE
jgi:MFS family permease